MWLFFCLKSFRSAVGIETLLNLIRHIDDGHVMLQTLRACHFGDSSFERDYTLEWTKDNQ